MTTVAGHATGSVIGTAAVTVGLLAVVHPRAWRVTRHLVTLVHEACHAGVAVLLGRRVRAVRLGRDGGGVTTTTGRPAGPARVLTAMAGYVGPAALAWLLAQLTRWGMGPASLASVAVLFLCLSLVGRGLRTVLLTLTLFGLLLSSLRLPDDLAGAVATGLSTLLSVGAIRSCHELLTTHRLRSRQPWRIAAELTSTDADTLEGLTGVRAEAWVAAFYAVALCCAWRVGITLVASP